MVYTSTSLALAALEVFVHVRTQDEPSDLVALCAEVPVEATELEERQRKMLETLPKRWRFEDVRLTRRVGDTWMASGTSLALPVPSVVIEGEWNVLLNPAHRDAAKIKVVTMRPFRFDERMFAGNG